MYLPPGINFRDPRNMSGPEIQKLFDFWRDRQAEHGPDQTLRWSYYVNGRRESVRVEYGHRADQEKADKGVVGKRKRRARAKKSAVSVPAPDFDNMFRMPDLQPGTSPAAQPPQGHDGMPLAVSGTGDGPEGDLCRPCQSVPAVHMNAIIHTDASGTATSQQDAMTGQEVESQSTRPDDRRDGLSDSPTSMYPTSGVVDGITVPSGFTLVDDKILELFRNRGMPIPVAANGPGDGLPRYLVSISDVQSLRFDVEEELYPGNDSRPTLQTEDGSNILASNDIPASPVRRKRKVTTTGATASKTQKRARHTNQTMEHVRNITGNRILRSHTTAPAHTGVRTRTAGKSRRQATM